MRALNKCEGCAVSMCEAAGLGPAYPAYGSLPVAMNGACFQEVILDEVSDDGIRIGGNPVFADVHDALPPCSGAARVVNEHDMARV